MVDLVLLPMLFSGTVSKVCPIAIEEGHRRRSRRSTTPLSGGPKRRRKVRRAPSAYRLIHWSHSCVPHDIVATGFPLWILDPQRL